MRILAGIFRTVYTIQGVDKNVALKILLLISFMPFLGRGQQLPSTFEITDDYRKRVDAFFPIPPPTEYANYLRLIALNELKRYTAESFGGDSTLAIHIDYAGIPPILGTVVMAGDTYSYTAPPGLDVRDNNGERHLAYSCRMDTTNKSKVLKHGRFSWFVQRIGPHDYLRVSDDNHPAVAAYKNFSRFPLTTKFIYDARYRAYAIPKKIFVPTIFGYEVEQNFIGNVAFDHDGVSYELDVTEQGLIMFSDASSGIDTYGTGRYVHATPMPLKDGRVTLDFNFAYNPPCAISNFTTCQFAPASNRLPFRVEAGEMYEPK